MYLVKFLVTPNLRNNVEAACRHHSPTPYRLHSPEIGLQRAYLNEANGSNKSDFIIIFSGSSTCLHNRIRQYSMLMNGVVQSQFRAGPPLISRIILQNTISLPQLTFQARAFSGTRSKMGLDDWKYRAPYKVHENDPKFNVVYEGGCHCGRVKYQLSREKPLDSKFCHCTTCQTLHGVSGLSLEDNQQLLI